MEGIFDGIYSKIQNNKNKKDQGKNTSIYPPFERLSRVFPGWERGTYTIITANSGIGKSKITKFLSVLSVYYFAKLHSIPVKIFYFALEESKDEFWISILSSLLYEKYGIEKSNAELKSLGKHHLDEDTLRKIQECRHDIEDMSKYIDVIDYISNGTGIYKHVRNFFLDPEIGEDIIEEKNGERHIVGYKPKNPELYCFIVTDQVNLLMPENLNGSKQTLHEAMSHYSKEYCLKQFCKRFKAVVINVQQQAAEQEKQEFYRGETVEQKLEPSLDGLGDNKTTARDADLVLGIFSPARYNIKSHRKYNIEKLGDRYRSIRFLKDRSYGLANVYVPLYFNGASNMFEELPPFNEIKYEDYERRSEKRKQEIQNRGTARQ